jgi:TonB family protein
MVRATLCLCILASLTPVEAQRAKFDPALIAATQKRLFGETFDETVKKLAPVDIRDLINRRQVPTYGPGRLRHPPPNQDGLADPNGLVIVGVVVDTRGIVRNARILKSIPTLDVRALETVKRYRYVPVTVDKKPVAFGRTETVNFVRR